MKKAIWLEHLNRLEQLARTSRWRRWWQQPLRYSQAMYWLKWVYPRTQRPLSKTAPTFFEATMHLELPAGMDIYLLGGKTHDSEIRLARYLMQHLQTGNTFIDVGAHFGFFTLLGAGLVGEKGQVVAFEAAPSTFKTLTQNTQAFPQIHLAQKAVSDTNGQLTFHEFPTLYSEYNSLDVTAFNNTDWQQKAKKVEVEAITLSNYLTNHQLQPDLIKIDVEGAERKVIQGLTSFLSERECVLVIEVTQLHLAVHAAMEHDLTNLNYFPHRITSSGKIERIKSIQQLLENSQLDSDNVVFQKV